MSATSLDIAKAINNLIPRAAFAISDADLSTLVWTDERAQPELSAIEAELATVIANKPISALRAERDRRITETDWWVLPDRTPSPEQLAYRQALRDITQNYDSLETVIWPIKPVN